MAETRSSAISGLPAITTIGLERRGKSAMLYRLICPVLGVLKRIPHLLPLSLLAIFILVFGPILYAKIYQNWDTDADRGAIAISGGEFGEDYSTPRYLDQGWRANDSLWFYNTT